MKTWRALETSSVPASSLFFFNTIHMLSIYIFLQINTFLFFPSQSAVFHRISFIVTRRFQDFTTEPANCWNRTLSLSYFLGHFYVFFFIFSPSIYTQRAIESGLNKKGGEGKRKQKVERNVVHRLLDLLTFWPCARASCCYCWVPSYSISFMCVLSALLVPIGNKKWIFYIRPIGEKWNPPLSTKSIS